MILIIKPFSVQRRAPTFTDLALAHSFHGLLSMRNTTDNLMFGFSAGCPVSQTWACIPGPVSAIPPPCTMPKRVGGSIRLTG